MDIHTFDSATRKPFPVAELLDLPREFSTSSRGYAMKAEVDCKGACRMLAPGEMESHLAMDDS